MLVAFLADAKSTIKARTNRDETGATAVEYGIMVALIAIAIIVAVTLLGTQLTNTFKGAACTMSGKTFTAAAPAVPASGSTPAVAAVAEGCA
ncbi:hypothetical protein GCM10009784_02040 [Arthrobacter parietis]|uniref:Flp family type IVb pilin n=1 Tax=Arthrobacter parietis TaxID=271434 RepID=A0ABN3AM50_9MICC